jgi:HEAT repeats
MQRYRPRQRLPKNPDVTTSVRLLASHRNQVCGVGERLLDRDSGAGQYRAMFAIGLIKSTLPETAGKISDAMHILKSFITSLVLLALLASGCGRTQTAVPPSKTAQDTGQTENAESALATDGRSKAAGAGPPVGGNSNVVDQPVSADSPTQVEALTTAPLASDVPVQNLDSRLQSMLRSFHTTGDRVQRSAMATEMVKLADAGIPKPQIASALGYLFRDENSTDVKTEILNELGNLEDPSAYDQVVAGLDQHQPDEVHTAAIEALDSLGDKRAIPLIQPFLTDRDEDVRTAAQSATDSLNDQ